MKKICLILIAVLAVSISFTSCTNKKQQSREDQVEEFRSMLTAADTTQMLQLCDNAMELLKGKKIDEVIASLYEYNDSTKEAKPVSEKTAKRYTRLFKMFPVLEYNRVYYSFMLEGCNDVKYDVVFARAKDAGTDQDPKTAYMFNPVKINDEWKLCVKTLDEQIDQAKTFKQP